MEDRKVANSANEDALTWRVIPILHAIAAVALALWLAMVVLWPWLADGILSESVVKRVEMFLRSAFCHRMPSRSLFWHGGQLLVCARCTGVIAGYLLGAVLALCGAEKLPIWRVPFALLLIAMMGLSWLGGAYGILQESWHYERVVAGACGGLGGYILIARCIILLINWMHRERKSELAVNK